MFYMRRFFFDLVYTIKASHIGKKKEFEIKTKIKIPTVLLYMLLKIDFSHIRHKYKFLFSWRISF